MINNIIIIVICIANDVAIFSQAAAANNQAERPWVSQELMRTAMHCESEDGARLSGNRQACQETGRPRAPPQVHLAAQAAKSHGLNSRAHTHTHRHGDEPLPASQELANHRPIINMQKKVW